MSTMAVIGGVSAIAAVPMLLLTVISWSRHLIGQDASRTKSREGPIVVSMALLILPAIALMGRVEESNSAWFAGVTAAAVAGFALVAVGRALLFFEAVHPDAGIVVSAVGFGPVAVWLLSLAVIGIRDRDLPVLLGLMSVVMLILAVCGIAAATIRDRSAARCFGGVLMIVTVGWLSVMAVDLFRGA